MPQSPLFIHLLAGYPLLHMAYQVYWGSDPNGTGTTPVNGLTYQPTQTVPAETPYYLRIRTQDNAGNWSGWDTRFTFLFDDQFPTITSLTPGDDSLTTNPRPIIGADFIATGAEIDTAKTALIVDTEVIAPSTSTAQTVSYTPGADLSDARHYASFQIEDLAGNQVTSSWAFDVDATTFVTITAPADGTVVNQPTTPLALTTEGVAGLQITITGGAQPVSVTTDTGYWQTADFALNPGLNTLNITVQDPAGNTAGESLAITVDPTQHVALIQPHNPIFNPHTTSADYALTALAGTGWQVVSWQFTIIDTASQVVYSQNGLTPINNQGFSWDGRDQNGQVVADGAYTYQLALTVTDGNQTSMVNAPSQQVNVLTQAPAAPGLDCNSGTRFFSIAPALATGIGPEGATIYVYVDDVVVNTATVSQGTWQAAIPLIDDQTRAVRATVLDAAKNESASSSTCQMGLSRTDPFVAPHASLSETYIGLSESVSLLASTRTTGAQPIAVTITAPLSNPTSAPVQSPPGTWSATWTAPGSGSFEGFVVFNFDAVDTADPIPNRGHQFVQPYLDLVPPSVTITWPPDGQQQQSDTLSLGGRAEVDSTLTITATRQSDNQTFTTPANSDFSQDWEATLTLPDGNYTLTAQAIDRAGNVGPVSSSIAVTIDTTPPTIGPATVTRYAQPGANLVLNTTVTDALSGVSLVQAIVDDLPTGGQSLTLGLSHAGNNGYNTGLPIAGNASEGLKPLTLLAWDRAGNSTTVPDSQGIIVDATPPFLANLSLSLSNNPTGLALTNNTLYYGPSAAGDLTVSLGAGDDNPTIATAGLDTLTFPPLFNTPQEDRNLNGATILATYTRSYPVVSSQTVAGNFTLQAVDRAGNGPTVSSPFQVTRDETPPTLSNLTLSAGGTNLYLDAPNQTLYYGNSSSGTLDVSVTVEDSEAGLGQVIFPALSNDGHLEPVSGTGPQTAQHSYLIDGGQNTPGVFALTAADRVGNSSGTSFTLSLDTTPPTVSVNAPDSSSLKIPVSWDSPDPDRRDFDVQYSLDGSTWSDWLSATPETNATFIATQDQSVTFRVRASDYVGNVSGWVTAGPVAVAGVTKYYHHGGSRVAMRQGAEVHYLHGDHLGSTSLTTDVQGNVVAEGRYVPFGSSRWTSGSTPTDIDSM